MMRSPDSLKHTATLACVAAIVSRDHDTGTSPPSLSPSTPSAASRDGSTNTSASRDGSTNYVFELLATGCFTAVSERILRRMVEYAPARITNRLLQLLLPPHVREITLIDCESVTLMGLVDALVKCGHVEKLDLTRCDQLVHLHMFQFMGLHDIPVTTLILEGTDSLTDNCVKTVIQLLPHLVTLNLSSCSQITSNAFLVDAKLQLKREISPHLLDDADRVYNYPLSCIDVSGCRNITNLAVQHIVSLCGPHLRHLNLAWTNVECSVLLHLAGVHYPTVLLDLLKEHGSKFTKQFRHSLVDELDQLKMLYAELMETIENTDGDEDSKTSEKHTVMEMDTRGMASTNKVMNVNETAASKTLSDSETSASKTLIDNEDGIHPDPEAVDKLLNALKEGVSDLAAQEHRLGKALEQFDIDYKGRHGEGIDCNSSPIQLNEVQVETPQGDVQVQVPQGDEKVYLDAICCTADVENKTNHRQTGTMSADNDAIKTSSGQTGTIIADNDVEGIDSINSSVKLDEVQIKTPQGEEKVYLDAISCTAATAYSDVDKTNSGQTGTIITDNDANKTNSGQTGTIITDNDANKTNSGQTGTIITDNDANKTNSGQTGTIITDNDANKTNSGQTGTIITDDDVETSTDDYKSCSNLKGIFSTDVENSIATKDEGAHVIASDDGTISNENDCKFCSDVRGMIGNDDKDAIRTEDRETLSSVYKNIKTSSETGKSNNSDLKTVDDLIASMLSADIEDNSEVQYYPSETETELAGNVDSCLERMGYGENFDMIDPAGFGAINSSIMISESENFALNVDGLPCNADANQMTVSAGGRAAADVTDIENVDDSTLHYNTCSCKDVTSTNDTDTTNNVHEESTTVQACDSIDKDTTNNVHEESTTVQACDSINKDTTNNICEESTTVQHCDSIDKTDEGDGSQDSVYRPSAVSDRPSTVHPCDFTLTCDSKLTCDTSSPTSTPHCSDNCAANGSILVCKVESNVNGVLEQIDDRTNDGFMEQNDERTNDSFMEQNDGRTNDDFMEQNDERTNNGSGVGCKISDVNSGNKKNVEIITEDDGGCCKVSDLNAVKDTGNKTDTAVDASNTCVERVQEIFTDDDVGCKVSDLNAANVADIRTDIVVVNASNMCVDEESVDSTDDEHETMESASYVGDHGNVSDDYSSTVPGRFEGLVFQPRLISLDLVDINFRTHEGVEIRNTKFGELVVKKFFNVNKCLQHFAIMWKGFSADLLKSVLPSLRDLEDVALEECTFLQSGGVAALARECPKLCKVNLRGVVFFKDMAMTPYLGLKNLTTLSLAESQITDVTLTRLSNRLAHSLTDLDISWCGEDITERGVNAVCLKCTKLKILKMRMCPVSDTSLQLLAESCRHLTTLVIESVEEVGNNNNVLSDAGVITLAENLTELRVLDISWNLSITNLSLHAILSHCYQLKEACFKGLKRITCAPFLPIIATDMPEDCHNATRTFHRSTVYAPNIRVLDLEYSDLVEDVQLKKVVNVCQGLLKVTDYYGQRMEADGMEDHGPGV